MSDWNNNYLANAIGRHCELADGKGVIVAVTDAAKRKFAKALDGARAIDNCIVSNLAEVTSRGDFDGIAVVLVVAGSIVEARESYITLDPVKLLGIPTLMCIPERPTASGPPSWQNAGVMYEGMFYLAAQYVGTVRPRKGAYCEFGVYDGRSFLMAGHALKNQCGGFYAFDSYQGIGGALDGETDHYKDGDYRANVQTLEYNLRYAGLENLPYKVISGFFEETLVNRTSVDDDIGPISIVHIDVDVYYPAKLALNYVTPGLSDGALLMFDDYDQLAARNDLGERRALAEWLDENPEFTVEPYRNYGVFCRSFIVHKNTN